MKKFILMSFMLVLSCVFVLTGCMRNMTIQEFEKASSKALENTYEILLTDKTNLSTHGDFTLVENITEKNYNQSNQTWETSNTITTIKRAGKGTNTIFEKTEYTKTDGGLGGIEEKTTKYIYTAISSGGNTTYYILKEFKANNETEVKTIHKTFLSEALFINEVYGLVANNLMEELYEKFYFGTGFLALATGFQPEIKGNQSNCQFKMTYSTSELNSSNLIERATGTLKIELKNSKFDTHVTSIEEFENGIKIAYSETTTKLSYSADISRIENLDAYGK